MPKVDHTKNIIELSGISFSYGDDLVLRKVSLAIHQGDYLGIVGPNGGGKTTLLKIMLGLLRPKEGTVSLFGTDIRKFKEWSRIGYVPQKATNFDPNFPATVEEVVAMGRFSRRGPLHSLQSSDRLIIKKSLEQVEMGAFANRRIGDLSGGQQQRALIARALAGEPEVIVLDEPATGVDEPSQEAFYALLRELNLTRELTLVLVSHDQTIIERESTEIAHVHQKVTYKVNHRNV